MTQTKGWHPYCESNMRQAGLRHLRDRGLVLTDTVPYAMTCTVGVGHPVAEVAHSPGFKCEV